MPAQIQSLSHLSTLKSTITTVQELSSRVLALQRWQEAGVAGGNLALADLNIDTFNVAGPQAKGLYFDGVNKLSMSAADATHPGGISLGAQVIPGAKTFPALITASLGVTSGAATLLLYSTLGAGASDVLLKLGSSVADGSVNASAKLVSVRTGVGGTEVEYAAFQKNFVSFGGAGSVGGKNAFAVTKGNSNWEFSQGLSNLTPSLTIRNTSGKACGFLSGTTGTATYFDGSGSFYFLGETRANIDAGNMGSGPLYMQIAPPGLIYAATYYCGTVTGSPKGALQNSGEYENLVNGGGTILLSPGGTRYRTQNTNPGGITVTNIATATVTTSVIGTNTGDITLAAFGTTPNANGLTLTGQVLNMEPASVSQPGGVSKVAQTFAGVKTFHVDGNNTTLATLSSNELQIESSKTVAQTPVLKLLALTTPVAQFYASPTGAAVLESLLTTTLKVAGQDSLYADGTGLVQVLPGAGTPSLRFGAVGSPRAYVSFDMATTGTMTAASDGYIDFVSNSFAASFGRFRWLFSGSAVMTLSDNMWLAPSSAAGLTLGTSALPWGNAFMAKPTYVMGTMTGNGSTQAAGQVPSVTDGNGMYTVTNGAGNNAITMSTSTPVGTIVWFYFSAANGVVFPPSGGQFVGAAVNAGITTTKFQIQVIKLSSTQWGYVL